MNVFNLENFLNNIFESKQIKKLENNNYLFVMITLLSLFFTFSFSDDLENNQALGTHTISIFIPFIFYSTFLLFEKSFYFFKFLIFLLISMLPLYDHLFNEIFHLEGDDSTFYTLSAQYMIDNVTLRSNYSDEALIDLQPGISYLLAIEMLIFGGQNRIMQIFNISIFFVAIYYLLHQIKDKNNFHRLILLLVILIIPYSVKNILYTYSEWFAVLLFLLSIISFNSNKIILASILIALTPFVRQNLLLVSCLIFFTYLIIINKNLNLIKCFVYILIFLGILMLPVYLNLYYAGELVFFAKQKPYNIEAAKSLLDLINPIFIFNYFNDYLNLIFLQFERLFLLDGRKLTNVIISLFVPILFIISVLNFFIIKNNLLKVMYILVFTSAFAPTILLGSLAPPRFEYVNLCFIYFYFVLININEKISEKINL